MAFGMLKTRSTTNLPNGHIVDAEVVEDHDIDPSEPGNTEASAGEDVRDNLAAVCVHTRQLCLLNSLLLLASPCGEKGSNFFELESPASTKPLHHEDSCRASSRLHKVLLGHL